MKKIKLRIKDLKDKRLNKQKIFDLSSDVLGISETDNDELIITVSDGANVDKLKKNIKAIPVKPEEDDNVLKDEIDEKAKKEKKLVKGLEDRLMVIEARLEALEGN